MSIEAVNAISGTTPLSRLDVPEPSSQVDLSTNNNQFMSMISNLDSQVKEADAAITDFILNKNPNTHELMISLEEAKHSLQVSVEVRNKLVSAYEEVIRMRI